MDRRTFLKTVPAAAVLAGTVSGSAQGHLEVITLPKPEKDGGKSVLAALQERRTNRNISDKPLAGQMLSNPA